VIYPGVNAFATMTMLLWFTMSSYSSPSRISQTPQQGRDVARLEHGRQVTLAAAILPHEEHQEP